MHNTLAFTTERLNVYFLTDKVLKQMHKYIIANKERLVPFEPQRDENYYNEDQLLIRIQDTMKNRENKQGISFIFTPKNSTQVIGVINFTGFMFGVFQACYLGYSVDKDYENQGIMTEVLEKTLSYIYEEYGFHRIMANYLPDNIPTERVLQKLGFEKEGYAKSYLKINGEWKDHVLTSYIFQ